jgi:hypothetical protein
MICVLDNVCIQKLTLTKMALHSSLCLSAAAHKCSMEVGNLNAEQAADVFLHKLVYISWQE